MQYQAPWWLPGGHLQTIWSALYARQRRASARPLQRERWHTPDGDFIDVDRQHASAAGRPLLVMFHGLEGSSDSHYAQACADWAAQHDVHWVMPHFRGCGGELNQAPRAYHSGDHQEIDWILRRLRQEHNARGGQRMVAAGVSLGGNALMRWAAEAGEPAGQRVAAVASVCSPLDLAAGGRAIGRGFNRLVYTTLFLRTMKPKALAKLAQHPGLFDGEALLAARDLYAFDNLFTAPLHGFRDSDDYYARASAKPHLHRIRVPALALNARNDPFLPEAALPGPEYGNPSIHLHQPAQGGHVSFVTGTWPGNLGWLPRRIETFFTSR